MDKYKPSAKLFKALMHPARLAILGILKESEHCVCHLESQLGLRQAYISQQLAYLREAGLVEDRREGWNIYYSVRSPDIFTIIDAAIDIASREKTNLNTIHKEKIDKKPCPCPKCNPPKEAEIIVIQSIDRQGE
jgi:DNA-binding transcriptional ArsR family regulator